MATKRLFLFVCLSHCTEAFVLTGKYTNTQSPIAMAANTFHWLKVQSMHCGEPHIAAAVCFFYYNELFSCAGMTDPMTGEGIHTAMDSGRIAAHLLDEAFAVGNFDSAVMAEYQNRWMENFGSDFSWCVCVCV